MSQVITQGSFALIANPQGLLLTRRPDGQWNLPGGGVEPWERPIETVIREVEEEVNLKVIVNGLLGGPLVFAKPGQVDIAWAWRCQSLGGLPNLSDEVIECRYIGLEDLYLERGEIRLIASPYPIVSVTSRDRLSRTCRMIYDWHSVQAPAFLSCGSTNQRGDITVSGDGKYLVQIHPAGQQWWRRLDPFSESGYSFQSA